MAPMATAWRGTCRAGWAGSMITVHSQCGDRSAGTRGGRWTGRIWARGLEAVAVASKVGSSMSWHMART